MIGSFVFKRVTLSIVGALAVPLSIAMSVQKEMVSTIPPRSAFVPQARGALVAGLQRAVAYSGFRSGQHPDRGAGAKNPSRGEILADLRMLSSDPVFPLIRLYDSQENSRMVLEVIAEHGLPVRVMLGAWLDAEISNHESCAWLTVPIPESKLAANRLANAAEIKRAIQLAQTYPDIVVAVNIGNEALVDWNDHLVPIEKMLEYLRMAKHAIAQPITTADNYMAWIKHASALSTVVDFAGVHTYPIWEHKRIGEALAFTIENMVSVQQALPGIPLAIVEAGWASVSSEFPHQANEANQAAYFVSLMDWTRAMNVTTFWFEAFDEDWKGNPENPDGAEKHWGLYTVDREPKEVIHGLAMPAEKTAGGIRESVPE